VCREKGLVAVLDCPRIAEYLCNAIFMLYSSDLIITDALDTVFLSLNVQDALKPVFENERMKLQFGYSEDGDLCQGDLTLMIMLETGDVIKTSLPRRDGAQAFGEKLWTYYNSRKMVVQMKQTSLEKECFCCGASGQLKKCSGCDIAYYCSTECQRKNWREHKKLCRERVAHGFGGMMNIERATTSMIVENLRESNAKSVCTAHAKARIALSSTSLELSDVQVNAARDVDVYIVELAKKMAEAAVEMGRQLHVKDAQVVDVLQKQPECFAYTF
jgi:hypothetical protein